MEDKLESQIQNNHGVPSEVFYDHQDAERYRNQNIQLLKDIKELKEEIRQLKNPPTSRYMITRTNSVKKGK